MGPPSLVQIHTRPLIQAHRLVDQERWDSHAALPLLKHTRLHQQVGHHVEKDKGLLPTTLDW